MSALQIKQIPVLQDNYTYLVHDQQSGQSLVVDPALSQPVLDRAAALGWNINWIINTHHHPDHVDGNLAIKHQTGCQIVGPRADSARIPGIDQLVGDGDTFRLGERKATVLDIPGHTKGHIAYAFCADKALFSGDTIFVLGCGRMFEGTARQMWQSLL
ncbi:MAG: MBL fold metallo-hydrolase, partial [Pseudomonadota bacterium]